MIMLYVQQVEVLQRCVPLEFVDEEHCQAQEHHW